MNTGDKISIILKKNNVLPSEVHIIHIFRDNIATWSVNVLAKDSKRKNEIRNIIKKNWKNVSKIMIDENCQSCKKKIEDNELFYCSDCWEKGL